MPSVRTRYGQYPVHQISAYNCVGLEFFQEYLVHPDALPMQPDPANREPMTSLVQAGVTISELLQTAWLFPDIILPYLSRRFPTLEQLQEAMARLEVCVRALLLRMAETYAAETNRLIQDQYQRTQLVLEMTRQASRSLELDQVLRQVAKGIASAVGARHCLVHLVNEGGDHLVGGDRSVSGTGFGAVAEVAELPHSSFGGSLPPAPGRGEATTRLP